MKVKRIVSMWMLGLIVFANMNAVTVDAAKYEKDTGVEEEYLQTDAKVPKLDAKGAILMDANTGEILFQKNAKKKFYPASITKCMTSLVAIENCNLADTITYSDNAIFNVEAGSSGVALDVGEKITVDESLYGAMLESANECCNGLAEHTAGSIEGFVDMMNQKAQSLGCVNTHFNNANGLYDKNHYTCPYDMALIVKYAMQNEDWRRYSGTVSYQCAPTNKTKEKRYWNNHHKLLNGNVSYDNTLYTVEGGKTGYTVKCNNTLVTYAKSNTDDTELICVVMNGDKYYYEHGHSVAYTYKDTQNLLEYGFKNFSTITSSLDFKQVEEEDKNYFVQAYEMLQPQKFITFKAQKDCKIAISNTYDVSKLQGTLLFDKNNQTGKWGTYQYQSSGNVIASTDVYYDLNKDVLGELYKSSNKTVNMKNIGKVIMYLLIAVVLLGLIVGFVMLIRNTVIGNVFSRRRGYGTLRYSRKSMRRSRGRRRRGGYGYIDSSRHRRKRRYSKKNKLHF